MQSKPKPRAAPSLNQIDKISAVRLLSKNCYLRDPIMMVQWSEMIGFGWFTLIHAAALARFAMRIHGYAPAASLCLCGKLRKA